MRNKRNSHQQIASAADTRDESHGSGEFDESPRRRLMMAPLVTCLALTWMTLGCHRQEDTAQSPRNSSPVRPAGEQWDAVFLLGSKIGHVVTTWNSERRQDRDLVHWQQHTELRLTRFGDQSLQQVMLECWETPAGEWVECGWEIKSGQTVTGSVVTRQDDQYEIRDRGQTLEPLAVLDAQEDCGGYFAVEKSLLRSPLQPGEARMVRLLMPMVNSIVTMQLQATEMEMTETPSGVQELLRIESQMQLDSNTALDSTMWANANGEIRKTYLPTMQQETYKTNKSSALAAESGNPLDFGLSTVVSASRVPADIHRLESATYVVRLERDDPTEVLASCRTQLLVPIDERTANVHVVNGQGDRDPPDRFSVDRPQGDGPQGDGPQGNGPQDDGPQDDGPQDDGPPGEGDLAVSNLIQSTDARILEMANRIEATEGPETGGTRSAGDWELVKAIESHVNGWILDKNFSRALSSAVEVLETRQGDCTEHATLLAALCRARSIPARVVLGLIYSPADQGFAYHMWNEVWLQDHWMPVDATLGQGGIGAGHIKVGHSDLSGANAMGTLLPVIRVLGQIEIEFVE